MPAYIELFHCSLHACNIYKRSMPKYLIKSASSYIFLETYYPYARAISHGTTTCDAQPHENSTMPDSAGQMLEASVGKSYHAYQNLIAPKGSQPRRTNTESDRLLETDNSRIFTCGSGMEFVHPRERQPLVDLVFRELTNLHTRFAYEDLCT